MDEKFPKKETMQDEELDLLEAEELPEDSKDKPRLSTRSTPGGSDSTSGVEARFESPEDASSAESRSSESTTGTISKPPPSVLHPYRSPDSFASARVRSSKSCSPTSRRQSRSTLGSSDSTSGVDVRYKSPEGASSSSESRSGESATGATPKHSTSVAQTASRRKRSHSTSSIGTLIKTAAAAIKSSIVHSHFKRTDVSSGPSRDTTPLMLEENESSDSVEEAVESKMKLSNDEVEENMEVLPTAEASDTDVSMQGDCGGKSAGKVDSQLEEGIEMQLSMESSSEGSCMSDEKARLTGIKSENWVNRPWSLESTKSSLPTTATTSVDSLESLWVDDSADVDSYEEAQIQGRRRQREADSEETEEMNRDGPVKRLILERRDRDDDEGPPDQGLPLPSIERLI